MDYTAYSGIVDFACEIEMEHHSVHTGDPKSVDVSTISDDINFLMEHAWNPNTNLDITFDNEKVTNVALDDINLKTTVVCHATIINHTQTRDNVAFIANTVPPMVSHFETLKVVDQQLKREAMSMVNYFGLQAANVTQNLYHWMAQIEKAVDNRTAILYCYVCKQIILTRIYNGKEAERKRMERFLMCVNNLKADCFDRLSSSIKMANKFLIDTFPY